MEQPISFILGSHNHLPLGTSDDVFERTYHNKLKPFISTLYKYPKIQATLHYSGILLQRLERAHPEFFMLIRDMVSRKQIELLSGGFYEPMMPLIPLSDKIGQLELLTTYIRKQFGKRPQGCRLPALAWEQSLVGPLNTCGILYTFLDEGQFSLSGLSDENPCITEDQGKIISVFPVSCGLNQQFAQQRASAVLENMLIKTHSKDRVICVFPDRLFAENGDQAPDTTYQFFFEDIARFETNFNFTSPDKIFKNLKNLKKAYFPGSISLDALSKNAPLPRGELPRQFLISYPEANGLYAKMMFTHVLINQLKGDKSRKRTAREELWKAQGYDSFCPAVDGGIYHSSIRKAAYKSLIEAEKISREKNFTPSLTSFDFDLDGKEEYLFQGEQTNCYIRTQGASIFELDYLPRAFNYMDTFSPFAADGGRRTAFADVLVPIETSFESAFENTFNKPSFHNVQEGLLDRHPGKKTFRFCTKENFELTEIDKPHEKLCFHLPINAEVPFGNIEIEKIYNMKKGILTVRYILINKGHSTEFIFIPSIDLSFPGEGESFIRVFRLNADINESVNSGDAILQTEGIKFQDIKNEVIIVVASDKPFDAYILPIRIPCPLENSYVDVYQSTNIIPIKTVSLEQEERFEIEFSIRMYH
jgi:hypothetical protein